MEKQEYIRAEIQITEFQIEDVMTSSVVGPELDEDDMFDILG